MTKTNIKCFSVLTSFAALSLSSGAAQVPVAPAAPQFELVQPELFAADGGQPNAWADSDLDGDLDLFVGFRGRPNRLYRNSGGRFEDVAAAAGLADTVETRAAAWGDYDADGDPDLYVGFATREHAAKIYRNDHPSARFTEVSVALGIELRGVSRQPAWVDYDGDGDLDLFAAFRDGPNRLFRNDGARFVDVTTPSGIGDPRRTVGAVWWDVDADGDLDVFVANQEGDANGVFRNDAGTFTDVAVKAGVSAAGRQADFGGVGASLADIELDGDFDLFVANYGPSALYRAGPDHTFVDVAREMGIAIDGHATTSAFGDVNRDGWPDLYIGAFLANEPHYRDWLFVNRGAAAGSRFAEQLPALLRQHDATHGVQFADFDGDGRLDLSLTNNDATGSHPLLRNVSADPGHGLSVSVSDARGRHTLPGAEVRVYRQGSRQLIAAGLVDSGSGYCSQNVAPVFLGLPAGTKQVTVEVTVPSRGERRVTRQQVVVSGPRTKVEVRTR